MGFQFFPGQWGAQPGLAGSPARQGVRILDHIFFTFFCTSHILCHIFGASRPEAHIFFTFFSHFVSHFFHIFFHIFTFFPHFFHIFFTFFSHFFHIFPRENALFGVRPAPGPEGGRRAGEGRRRLQGGVARRAAEGSGQEAVARRGWGLEEGVAVRAAGLARGGCGRARGGGAVVTCSAYIQGKRVSAMTMNDHMMPGTFQAHVPG